MTIQSRKPRKGDVGQLALFPAGGPKSVVPPLSEDPIRTALAELDADNLTPMEALKKLAELSKRARKKK